MLTTEKKAPQGIPPKNKVILKISVDLNHPMAAGHRIESNPTVTAVLKLLFHQLLVVHNLYDIYRIPFI